MLSLLHSHYIVSCLKSDFSSGCRLLRAKHTVIDYEVQIKAAVRGLLQRMRTVTLEKRLYSFSSHWIIMLFSMVSESGNSGTVLISIDFSHATKISQSRQIFCPSLAYHDIMVSSFAPADGFSVYSGDNPPAR